MPKLIGPKRRTHPLIWCAAIICTIIAVAVIITGLVIFIGYMIIRPRLPSISVTYAHLDKLDFDQVGQLDTQITLTIKAENDNVRAHATFADIKFILYFHGLQIAQLTADPFEVAKNSSVDLAYVVPSFSIPLEQEAMQEVDASLKKNRIIFYLKGDVRTQWKVGVLGSVRFWDHLSCQLHFFPSNQSSTNDPCSSKSH